MASELEDKRKQIKMTFSIARIGEKKSFSCLYNYGGVWVLLYLVP